VIVVEAPDKIVGIVSTMDVLKALEAGRSFAA
jgi:hypothetical protein